MLEDAASWASLQHYEFGRRFNPFRLAEASDYPLSLHDRRALQISPDGQRTRIRLLEFADCRFEIELTDVTYDQTSNARVPSDAPHHRGCRVQRARGAGRNGEVHDQHIGVPGEINEFRICAVLIGTEDDRSGRRFDAVGEGWHVRVGYSQRRHGQNGPFEYD